MQEQIKKWYSARNIRNIKIEFGTYGKFNQYICKIEYSKNNVDVFTDFFNKNDIDAILKS